MKTPILKGPRIILRPIKVSDAKNFVNWYKDKDVMIWFDHRFLKAGLKEVQSIIRKSFKNKETSNNVIINENAELIGSCDFKILSEDNRIMRFGIMIGDKKNWGKGYAGECVKLVADYTFRKKKFNRLELTVSSRNIRGLKAYVKAGFVQEGTMRKYRWNKITERFEDETIMSILKKDWLKNN